MSSYDSVKKHYINRKQDIVYIMGDKCACCGYNKCNSALELHHLNPDEKSFTISQNTNKAWAEIVEELPKTILVCANCHREIHSGIIENSLLKTTFIEERAIEINKKLAEQKRKTLNFCQRCHKEISSKATFCSKCFGLEHRMVERPDSEQLKQLLIDYKGNFSEVGRLFGLSGNAIVKWCKGYDLPYHSGDYKPIKKEKTRDGLPKAVCMLDKNTEKVLNEFESMQAAANFLGNNGATHIGDVCRGKRKTAYGYKWKYKE